ncbi:MAG: glycosyltransferase family 39 protein, partial [Hyphomicrobiales bacterium]|nr:glycosyltransferase family 39 protein [Hyphomicrobiales bacterium]
PAEGAPAASTAVEEPVEPIEAPLPPVPPAPPKPGWPGLLVGFLGRSRIVSFALLLVVSTILFLPGFFAIPPVDRDEARFAQASRQMVQSGDFIDIRFQAEPRHKKPIGIYWMQAAAAVFSGEGDRAPIWVYRLPSIAGAILAVLFLYWAALPLAGRVGAFYAGLLMAGVILIGVEARLAKTDAMLLATVIAAQGGLIRAFLADETYRLRRFTTFVFWTAIGVGVLLKGPVILMVVGLTALTLVLMTRSIRWIGRLRPLTGLLWVALIAAPWIIAITIVTKGAFFTEAIGRDLLAKVTSVQESHGAPPGTYLAILWATFWPASVFFLLALPWIFKHWRERAVLFCFAWVVPSWIVFELVATKLPHYVLPLYPAFAIVTGMAIDRGGANVKNWWRKIVAVLLPIVPIAIAAAVPTGLYWFEQTWSIGAVALTLLAAAAGIAGFIALLRDDVHTGLAAALVAALLIYAGVYHFAFPAAQSIWVSPRLAKSIERMVPCPDPQIAATGYHEPSLVFLTRTDLTMTDAAGAAQFLADGGCKVALVEAAGEEAFTTAAGGLNLQPRLVDRVAGRNIGGGDPVDIGLYVSGANGQ